MGVGGRADQQRIDVGRGQHLVDAVGSRTGGGGQRLGGGRHRIGDRHQPRAGVEGGIAAMDLADPAGAQQP